MTDDLRRLGFNDHVQLGARQIHVQTEVVGKNPLKARTMVFEGGQLLDTAQRDLDSDPERAGDAVRLQHDDVLERARAGKY